MKINIKELNMKSYNHSVLFGVNIYKFQKNFTVNLTLFAVAVRSYSWLEWYLDVVVEPFA